MQPVERSGGRRISRMHATSGALGRSQRRERRPASLIVSTWHSALEYLVCTLERTTTQTAATPTPKQQQPPPHTPLTRPRTPSKPTLTMIPRVLTSRTVLSSVGRFDSLIPAGAHSKVGKIVKSKTFKTSGAGQPFLFEGAGQSSKRVPFGVETSLRK
ncbi:hypothetical protein ACHAXT_006445 [Thalassiosira profunda]